MAPKHQTTIISRVLVSLRFILIFVYFILFSFFCLLFHLPYRNLEDSVFFRKKYNSWYEVWASGVPRVLDYEQKKNKKIIINQNLQNKANNRRTNKKSLKLIYPNFSVPNPETSYFKLMMLCSRTRGAASRISRYDTIKILGNLYRTRRKL